MAWVSFEVKSEQAKGRHYLPVIAKIELKFGMDGEIEISENNDWGMYLISEMMWLIPSPPPPSKNKKQKGVHSVFFVEDKITWVNTIENSNIN